MKANRGKTVADRSAIIAFGSPSEPRRTSIATSILSRDKALGSHERTPLATGTRKGYVYYAPYAKREKAAKRWRDWLVKRNRATTRPAEDTEE